MLEDLFVGVEELLTYKWVLRSSLGDDIDDDDDNSNTMKAFSDYVKMFTYTHEQMHVDF